MSCPTVLALACGLAVDSCLVALAQGLVAREHKLVEALRIGLVFGAFQGGLAIAGWFAGEPVARSFGYIDHWIAFTVLLAIGVRTIHEAYANEDQPRIELTATRLAMAAVATSIDACGSSSARRATRLSRMPFGRPLGLPL